MWVGGKFQKPRKQRSEEEGKDLPQPSQLRMSMRSLLNQGHTSTGLIATYGLSCVGELDVVGRFMTVGVISSSVSPLPAHQDSRAAGGPSAQPRAVDSTGFHGEAK